MKDGSFSELRKQLMARLDTDLELTDEEILERIDQLILQDDPGSARTLDERVRLRSELFSSVRKLDVLQELIDDETVTEIMVNGPEHIFIERKGKLTRWDGAFSSAEKLYDVIRRIAGKCNRVISESDPIVDARLPNGDRVNAVVAPAALNGPILTIRRFPGRPVTMERLIVLESLDRECAGFLCRLVRAKYSILIGGGTGTGKTTFLGALSGCIPKDERIVTIEDNAELRLPTIENLVRLEAKAAGLEGGVSITIRDLIRTALRMRPDRIIVGEVRGEEAADMMTALNSGHEGSLCTLHANSCADMITRLEMMILAGMNLPMEAVQRMIASGVDVLIFLGRMKDRSRKLLEICEVDGFCGGEVTIRPLYRHEDGKGLVKCGVLHHDEKLNRLGE